MDPCLEPFEKSLQKALRGKMPLSNSVVSFENHHPIRRAGGRRSTFTEISLTVLSFDYDRSGESGLFYMEPGRQF
jgi:hypothetical protein